MMKLFDKMDECCGCGACRWICPVSAISFERDDEGFEYPHIDDAKCINCGLCEKACDFKKTDRQADSLARKIYAAKIKDDAARKKSSSGGMFTAFSDYFLHEGGVIYGAAHNEKFETVHIRAESTHDRDRCIGSKYVQSDLGDCFVKIKEDLAVGRKVFFTGTPCQVAGLRSYLEHSPCLTDNLFMADLVCHGVPSPLLFQEFIKYCESKSHKKIVNYFHRPKDNFGWSHNEKAIYNDSTYDDTSSLIAIWRTLFYSNIIIRPSCLKCKYASPCRRSDITIADFWGIENVMPDFFDSNGVSLLFLNTEKSLKIFDEVKLDMEVRESRFEDCTPHNPNLLQPSVCMRNRDTFWKIYKEKGFETVAKKYGGYGLKSRVKKLVRNILEKLHLLWIVRKICN